MSNGNCNQRDKLMAYLMLLNELVTTHIHTPSNCKTFSNLLPLSSPWFQCQETLIYPLAPLSTMYTEYSVPRIKYHFPQPSLTFPPPRLLFLHSFSFSFLRISSEKLKGVLPCPTSPPNYTVSPLPQQSMKFPPNKVSRACVSFTKVIQAIKFLGQQLSTFHRTTVVVHSMAEGYTASGCSQGQDAHAKKIIYFFFLQTHHCCFKTDVYIEGKSISFSALFCSKQFEKVYILPT